MKIVGIVLAGGRNTSEITKRYASAMLPVGGYYNAIDFSLSNMVNSGIKKVAVVTQYSSRLLNEHLKSQTWWGFGRKNGGMYLISPMVTDEEQVWYSGTIDALYDTLDFLKESHEPYVAIASGDGVYRLDYNEVLASHIETGADITVVSAALPEGEHQERFGVLHRDKDDRIISFSEKEGGDESARTISCGIYVMRRRTLIELIEKAKAEGKKSFVDDVLIPGLPAGKTFAYKTNGYWKNVSEANAFYECNMDFLKPEVRKEFLKCEPPIHTRVLDRSPAKYLAGSKVTNSLIGSGATISGEVSDSVLFAGVSIGKGAVVKRSIIFPNTEIKDGEVIEDAVVNNEHKLLQMR